MQVTRRRPGRQVGRGAGKQVSWATCVTLAPCKVLYARLQASTTMPCGRVQPTTTTITIPSILNRAVATRSSQVGTFLDLLRPTESETLVAPKPVGWMGAPLAAANDDDGARRSACGQVASARKWSSKRRHGKPGSSRVERARAGGDICSARSMSTTSDSPLTCTPAQHDIQLSLSHQSLRVAQTVPATSTPTISPATLATGSSTERPPGAQRAPLNINDDRDGVDNDSNILQKHNLDQSESNNLHAIQSAFRRAANLVGPNDCSSKLDDESQPQASAFNKRRTNSNSNSSGASKKLSSKHNSSSRVSNLCRRAHARLELSARRPAAPRPAPRALARKPRCTKSRAYKLLKVAGNESTVILPSWARPARPAPLLVLLFALLGLLLAAGRAHQPASGLLAAAEPQASTSDELSRAVLATMSTQAPPAADQLNGSSAQPAQELAKYLADELAPSALERLLELCRIFIMGSIIVGDICGNSLVILSVCRHSKLRVTTNWFVVSLACADILVALFAMTFNASVIIWGRWLFQRWVCDFWNSCDVLASTASILHLCCISIDRYIAITRPLDYPMKITTRRVMYALCAVWISSALLSYIPIFTGIYTTEEHQLWLRSNPDQCEFTVNRVYAVVSSSVSFWIPCCIMVFTYYRIYREASRQEKFIYKAQSMMPQPMANHQHHGVHSNHQQPAHQRSKQRRSKSIAAVASSAGLKPVGAKGRTGKGASAALMATTQLDANLAPSAPLKGSVDESSLSLSKLDQETVGAERQPLTCPEIVIAGRPQQAASVSFNSQLGSSAAAAATNAANTDNLDLDELDEPDSNSGQSTPTKRSISKMKREHKAAKTLGIIMGVFILCWFPFFTWYTSQHICGKECEGMVPKSAVTILFWIGYFNSTLNPIIYAYFNHEFRDAFKKTLQWIFCCCSDLKCLRVSRPNDNQHYNCTYRSTQEIGLVSNG